MVGAYAYGPVAVIEQFIEGTEVTVTVADRGDGPAALPAVEIRPESGVYDYTVPLHRGCDPVPLPGRDRRRRWPTRAPRWRSRCTTCSVCGTCPGPT